MQKIKKRQWTNIAVPLISVLSGFILGAIVMLMFGYDPIQGYSAMFESAFATPRNIGEIFVAAAPLMFTALGFALANTAGFFNIGLPGQALCGWIASIAVALSMPTQPKWLVVTCALVAGFVAGALAGMIPGILRAYFGTSEVIVTIMLNYIILYVSNYLVNSVMPTSWIATMGVTNLVGDNARLQTHFLQEWSQYSRLNIGIFIAVAFLVLYWFLMKKTTLGYEIRSVGLNPHAAEYAGMSSKRTAIVSMVISGGLAGIGGVIYGLGSFGNFFSQSASLSIGFNGMAVALLGSGSAIGILLSALLFSILQLGGQGMPLYSNIPTELVDVVIAAIIFFVGISYVIRYCLDKATHQKVPKTMPSESEEGGEL